MLDETDELILTDININKVESDDPLIFTEVYKQNINIAIWKRTLSQEILSACNNYSNQTNQQLEISLVVSPNNVLAVLSNELPNSTFKPYLLEDITQLVDMFCCLFDLRQVGLRLVTLEQAMCPRFHVDRLPCRLVTTYSGIATEWLHNQDVDRHQLGKADYPTINNGSDMIQRLSSGDVALLKGELWQDNTGYGLVHRSPKVKTDEKRLLLTLDFM